MNRDYLKTKRHFVYRHFDADGRTLYVGCSHDVRRRFRQQLFESTWWAEKVEKTRVTVHASRAEALQVEKSEIARLEPLHSGEIYLMSTGNWTADKFIDHGLALAEGTGLTVVDGRSSIGMLFNAYLNKFGRDLFADMGPVAPGKRNSVPSHDFEARQIIFKGQKASSKGRAA